MKVVTEWLFRGIWWFDALVLCGIGFLLLLVFGIPVWMLVSRVWWRRRDAQELMRLLERINAAKDAEAVNQP